MSVRQIVTAEELWDHPEVPGKRLELVNGEVDQIPGSGVLHSIIATTLLRLLYRHVDEQGLGLVFPDGLGYILRRNPDHVRIPDISFIAWDSVPEGDIEDAFWEGAPTLAVEVVSPNDRADDIHDRVQDYLEAGSSHARVLWLRRKSMSVYRPDADTRELGSDTALDASDILSGFSVRGLSHS